MEVAEGRYEAGLYNMELNVSALQPGVYYYRMDYAGHTSITETRKMVVGR
jgi:hypothetical protein